LTSVTFAQVKTLLEKIADREAGICLYGIAPPKRATEPAALETIARQQIERVERLRPDGLILYDIQDESERTATPRPFPFLPTLSPELYAEVHLRALRTPKIVYRAVTGDSRHSLIDWLQATQSGAGPRLSVLVGAPSGRAATGRLRLDEAYALAERHAPRLVLGGIAIAERHHRTCDEHQRMIAKVEKGCRFLVTQAVYDVTSTKSLLSDFALALAGRPAVPIIATFSPCGSPKTLEFMKWLGVSFPRWLENELRHSSDILVQSVALCTAIFAELLDYAREKRIPLGINVESVSIRRAEIDASAELYERLRALMTR
jgi:5,10-methylenetetrahydrofolate reductase